MLAILTELNWSYEFTFTSSDYHFQAVVIFSNEYFSHIDIIFVSNSFWSNVEFALK